MYNLVGDRSPESRLEMVTTWYRLMVAAVIGDGDGDEMEMIVVVVKCGGGWPKSGRSTYPLKESRPGVRFVLTDGVTKKRFKKPVLNMALITLFSKI
nr:hypothetical protein [Tanacetum cinerariifolium]